MRLLKKKGILTLLAVLLICGVTFVPNGFADTVTSYFNFDISNNPSAPEGQVTFTLNGDGTIAASLVDFNSNILGFGFDSLAISLTESNFSPAPPFNTAGWSDAFGNQPSGFSADSSYLQNVTVTWTIGNPGDFTSVLDALNGNTSTHPFFLYDDNNDNEQWGGDISSSSVPEPATMLLLGLGLAGLAGVRRKFKQERNT